MHFLRHNSIRSCLALLLFVATIAPGNAWVHWFLSCAEPNHHAHCFFGFFGHADHSHGHTSQACCHPVTWCESEVNRPGTEVCAASDCAAKLCDEDAVAGRVTECSQGRTDGSTTAAKESTEFSSSACAATLPVDCRVGLDAESSPSLGIDCPICSLFAKALQANLSVLPQCTELVVLLTALEVKFFQPEAAFAYLARGPPSLKS